MISQMGRHRLRSVKKVSWISQKVTVSKGQSANPNPDLSFPPLATFGVTFA